jgi:hypothetical protein
MSVGERMAWRGWSGLTRSSSAAHSEGELCFHFILHNSSFNLFIRRLGVGCSD